MSKILFFRHAQASFLSDNYDQLSERGTLQSKELGKYLLDNEVYFDKIYVGPLVRQQKTQHIVADTFQNAGRSYESLRFPIQIEAMREHSGPEAMRSILPRWKEKDPKVARMVQEMADEPSNKRKKSILMFQYFMKQWASGQVLDRSSDIESWQDFRLRVRQGLNEVLSATGKGQTVGVFTSGGTIAAIVAEAIGIQDEVKVANLNFVIRNTSITQFHFSEQELNLISFNELPHLDKEMVTFV